jgi:hypothetical protein
MRQKGVRKRRVKEQCEKEGESSERNELEREMSERTKADYSFRIYLPEQEAERSSHRRQRARPRNTELSRAETREEVPKLDEVARESSVGSAHHALRLDEVESALPVAAWW